MSASDTPNILLTNDDGIESVGFRALYDALSAVGEVTAVAPADDQSAVGRALSNDVAVAEHELGYVVEGTPADCTVAGIEVLCPNVDIVVAGCNKGANIGAYTLGRSGTVSAAVEAGFFGVPAMAVSLYVPDGEVDWRDLATDPGDYRMATRPAAFLAGRALGAGVFEEADYLNLNAPMPSEAAGGPDAPSPIDITRPSTLYDMTAEIDGDRITLHDRVWDRMGGEELPDPDGTDRRAIFEGRISVSPLTAPHTVHHHDALDELVAQYPQ